MMTINDNIVSDLGITYKEALMLLHLEHGCNFEESLKSLYEKGYVTSADYKEGLNFTEAGFGALKALKFNQSPSGEKKYVGLAAKLREIYPSGRKEGTSYMWKGNTNEISKKIQTLKEKYNFQFTDEQAIKATKKYIESFNGDYRYMQLLKYFILKAVRDSDGNVDIKSELMTRIENEGQEDTERRDWVETLI